MKRLLALVLVFIGFVALFGCASEPEPSGLPALYRTVACEEMPANVCTMYSQIPTLEDSISGAYVIKATFVGDVGFRGKARNGMYEMEFTVDATLKGSIDEDTIYTSMSLDAYSWSEGECTIFNYVKGHQYLLIARKDDSVYYDHPYYSIRSSDFLPLDDDIGAFVWGYDLAAAGSDFIDREKMAELVPSGNAIEYIEKLCEKRPWVAEEEQKYTTSVDMYEIAKECEFVLAVTPKSISLVSDWRNTATYYCTVNRQIKNSSVKYPVHIGDEIHLPFFIDSVEEGEQYIVMVNRAGGADSGSSVFSLAAKTAVYASDEETIAALKEFLANIAG